MLRADLDRQWAVLHGLQIASQALLDLASHLAAAAGRDVPDYASAIQAMGDLGIFSPEVCRRCRPIAGFRNVLVHEYLDVDLEVVASVLANGLVDMRAAAAAIRAHLAAGS